MSEPDQAVVTAPQKTETAWRPSSSFGALYDFVAKSLPDYRTKRNFLDVPRLALEFEKSEEAIYKWFRTDNLTASNARKLFELSKAEENLHIIEQSGSTPPELSDFYAFVK